MRQAMDCLSSFELLAELYGGQSVLDKAGLGIEQWKKLFEMTPLSAGMTLEHFLFMVLSIGDVSTLEVGKEPLPGSILLPLNTCTDCHL